MRAPPLLCATLKTDLLSSPCLFFLAIAPFFSLFQGAAGRVLAYAIPNYLFLFVKPTFFLFLFFPATSATIFRAVHYKVLNPPIKDFFPRLHQSLTPGPLLFPALISFLSVGCGCFVVSAYTYPIFLGRVSPCCRCLRFFPLTPVLLPSLSPILAPAFTRINQLPALMYKSTHPTRHFASYFLPFPSVASLRPFPGKDVLNNNWRSLLPWQDRLLSLPPSSVLRFVPLFFLLLVVFFLSIPANALRFAGFLSTRADYPQYGR